MSLVQRTDYVPQAEARLPRVFRDKPRLFALLAAFAEGAQDFEAHAFGMYAPRFLANAAGATLDLYGAIVGQARLGMDDTSYRLRIRARMALNRSSGTIPDLIRIAQLLVPNNTVLLRESYPAALLMQIAGGATPLLEDVYQILYSAKAAGVSFRLTTQDGADAQRFVFQGGVGLGFGGYAPDWVGTPLQVQQGTLPPSLSPVTTVVNTSGAGTPSVSLTNTGIVPPLGVVTLVAISANQFTWTCTGGAYGDSSGGPMDNDGDPVTPTPLYDENVEGDTLGVSVLWADDDYNPGDTFRFTVTTDALGDSTAPEVLVGSPLTAAATGKWTFRIITGTPSYWFNYTRPDGTLGATQAMNRGTPVVLRDASLNPVGLSVTWPNVDAYYINARHTVRAHRGAAATGGHWTDVR